MYLIDTQNHRIGEKVNGTVERQWIYQDQLNPIAELGGSGNLINRFVYGDKGHVPAYMVKNDSTYRFITDHLGSVRLVVNSETGFIVQQISYDEFGNVLSNTNPDFQPFAYAGGLYDTDTELIRFGARDYDARAGRWMAKDPIGFDSGVINLYLYAKSSPMNLVDPTGEESWSPERCAKKLQKIQNIIRSIQRQEKNLLKDPGGLPGTCPGDDVKPRLSREGHQKTLNEYKENLARHLAEYLAYCGNPPRLPNPGDSYFNIENWIDTDTLLKMSVVVALVVTDVLIAGPTGEGIIPASIILETL